MFEVPSFILSTTSKQGEEQKEEADMEKEKRKESGGQRSGDDRPK